MNEFDIVKFSTLCDSTICYYIDYMYDAKSNDSVELIRERLMGGLDTISMLIDCMENKNLARYMENYVTKRREEAQDAYIDALNVLKTKVSSSDENK